MACATKCSQWHRARVAQSTVSVLLYIAGQSSRVAPAQLKLYQLPSLSITVLSFSVVLAQIANKSDAESAKLKWQLLI